MSIQLFLFRHFSEGLDLDNLVITALDFQEAIGNDVDDEIPFSGQNDGYEGVTFKKNVVEKSREKIAVEQDYERQQTEMKQLFGSQAEKVLGLESAMQLQFDKLCDKYKPRLWPVLPFNMKFD